MNQDEIIEMARHSFACKHCPLPVPEDRIVAFAKLVAEKAAAKEREEILNYAKSEKFSRLRGEFAPTADDLVKWIKKRGQT